METPTTDFMRGWLMGFFDGEGSAFFKTHSRTGKRHTNRYLSVGNTDLSLMHLCSGFLTALDIGHTKFTDGTKVRTGRKVFYELHIVRGADIVRFAELVGFVSPHKDATLRVMVQWIGRSRKHYRSAEIVELRKAGLSFSEIARRLGYAPGTSNHLADVYRLEEKSWQKNS